MSRIKDFTEIFNIITEIWNAVTLYKDMDIDGHEDAICLDMYNRLQAIKNKHSDKRSGKLVSDISTAILHFIFYKEKKW